VIGTGTRVLTLHQIMRRHITVYRYCGPILQFCASPSYGVTFIYFVFCLLIYFLPSLLSVWWKWYLNQYSDQATEGFVVQFPPGTKNFPISMVSRSALGPTQPRVQCIPPALSQGAITTVMRS